MLASLVDFLRSVVVTAFRAYWNLVKLMIPVMIAVKLLVELGAVKSIAVVFEPLMAFVGLPPAMGLAWATACAVSLYSGAIAMIGILPQAPMTVAQVTVLASMMLISHALPIEQRICQKAGVGLIFSTVFRLIASLVYGAILFHLYRALGLFQETADAGWLPLPSAEAGWWDWAQSSVVSLAGIFAILLVLIVFLRLMDVLGVTRALTRVLQPGLHFMGLGPQAAPLTMVGVLLGIAYGGALIIEEARSGRLTRREVLISVSLLTLCHSLIEDTTYMIALGGHWSGVLLGRIVFSVLVMAAMARAVNVIPEASLRWMVPLRPETAKS